MFTEKLSMDCSKEQYEEYLKPELLKMGYNDETGNWAFDQVIVNNHGGLSGAISNVNKYFRNYHSRTDLGEFNPSLFLALAAMTDSKYGNYGEWITNRRGIFIKISKDEQSNDKHWRKATVSEIMNKFGNQPDQKNNNSEIMNRLSNIEKLILSLAKQVDENNKMLSKCNEQDNEPISKKMWLEYYDWKKNLYSEMRGGKLMFDVSTDYKWLEEKELFEHFIKRNKLR